MATLASRNAEDIRPFLFKEAARQGLNDTLALVGPLVWSARDYASPESYSLILNAQDVDEIDRALGSFKALSIEIDEVARTNFPLPTLGPKLDIAARQIDQGRGFFVVKGIESARYSAQDKAIIFLGISSFVGDKRGIQDKKGNVLSHITSSKLWQVPEEKRHTIHSRKALPFHTDMGCDIHGLQVQECAIRGGSTFLSPVWTIVNMLMGSDPDVVKTLLTPDWPVQMSGTSSKFYMASVLAIHDGKLLASMDPNRLGPHPASESEVPRLTQAQQYALERLACVAQQVELQLCLEKGDMLFFNNLALLHRRDDYVDAEDTCRHLVRLWLRNTQHGWLIPDQMLNPWLAAYGDDLTNKPRLYPLHPSTTYTVPKYTTGSAAYVLDD